MIPVAEKCEKDAEVPVKTVLLAAGVLGFSYATTQLALMRELLTAFSGNEMVLGFVLGGWLLLMGLGTLAGRFSDRLRQPIVWLSVCQLALALIPPLQVFLLRSVRNVVFVRGAEVDPVQTLCAVLVLLTPYCIPGGLALALASASLLASDGSKAVGRVYGADAIGSVAGGVLFTLILVRFLDHIALLLVPAAANLLMAGALALHCRRPVLADASVTLAVMLPLMGIMGHPDTVSTQLQYQGQEIKGRANSEYGNLLLLEADGQLSVLQNDIPIGSSRDNFHSEETVHYAMAQRPDARRVLLAGGCLSGSPVELLKYSRLERIDCVELDPAVLRLSAHLTQGQPLDPRIHFLHSDPRSYLSETSSNVVYDVIMLDVPPPSTAALNRFFTVEFFGRARKVLAQDGVLAFSLGEYGNYVSPQFALLLSSAHATVSSQFRNVMLIPGGRVFFLASDGPLFEDIPSRIEAAGIKTTLLRRSYLESQLARDRFQDLERAAEMPAPSNRDFNPILYSLHLRHWLNQFDSRLGLASCCVVFLPLLGYVVYLAFRRPTGLVIFAAGFAGTALQLVLLLSYQMLCGSVYYQLGIIISLFMAGLALGVLKGNRPLRTEARWWRGDRPVVVVLGFAIVAFALALPHLLRVVGASNSHFSAAVPKVAIGILGLALAALLGWQFAVANRVEFDTTMAPASRLYTADFLGSFTGAILTCTVMVPLLGVAVTCYLTAALNLITATLFGFRVRSS